MTIKLQYYALRITTDNQPLVMDFLKKYSDKYLITWENADPPAGPQPHGIRLKKKHCHIYLETIKSRQSMVKWIQRNIGKGNGCYSMKALDQERPIEYLAYMVKECSKDDGRLYLEGNLPEECVKAAIEYDAKVKDEMNEKAKQKESITSFKTISAWLEDKDFHSPSCLGGERVDHIKLVQLVLRYYQENSLFVREFHITSLCQTLLLKFDKNYSYQLASKISERL